MNPDRAAWLEERRTGVGGSDVAGILGISPWASPWSIWADKLGLFPDELVDDDDPREFGRRAEAMLGPWFEDRTGYVLVAQQALVRHPDHLEHLTTLDGLVLDRDPCTYGGDCPVPGHPPSLHGPGYRPGIPTEWAIEHAIGTGEIKTDFEKPWQVIPAHYQCQGQWQLHVTGLDRVWFAVLHGRRFRTYELERNQADIDLMVERVDQFWTGHVLTGDPPLVDSSEATARALAAVYPTDDQSDLQVGLDVVGHLVDLVRAKADEKAAHIRAQAASNAAKAAAGDAYRLKYDNQTVATIGTQTKTATCEHCGHRETSLPFRVLRPSKYMKTEAIKETH